MLYNGQTVQVEENKVFNNHCALCSSEENTQNVINGTRTYELVFSQVCSISVCKKHAEEIGDAVQEIKWHTPETEAI